MKALKIWASMTMVLGCACGAGLLFSMLALQDIYHGTEPSLVREWAMVRMSTGLTLMFLVSTFITMMKLFRHFGNQDAAS